MLEYKEQMKDWSLDRQITSYRGMVFAQTQKEAVLAGVNDMKEFSNMLMSMESDQERVDVTSKINDMANQAISAVVSYVGKANYKEAEKYICDFRLWTKGLGNPICVEISAVNGRFVLDVIQPFGSPIYVNAFMKELEEHNISYKLQDVQELDLPNVNLEWNK